MKTRQLFHSLCLFLLLLTAAPAAVRAAPFSSPATTPIVAETITWRGFVKYWRNWGYRVDRAVLIVTVISGLAFLIVAFGGKWRK